MRLKPPLLLVITAAAVLLWSFFSKGKSVDLQFHDTYFVIGVSFLGGVIGGGCVLMAMVYYFMEGLINRPIPLKTGFWHFGLLAAGLFSGFIALSVQNPEVGGIYRWVVLLFVSTIFLLAGTAVFFYGCVKVLLKRQLRA